MVDAKGEVAKYVRGALQLKDKSQIGRIRYAIDSLGSPNEIIARSALIELERAKYVDLRKVAEVLKPEPVIAAIKDAETPLSQLGMYARLLGHCGKKEHAVLLRKLIDDNERLGIQRNPRFLEGAILGYVHLDPQAGWDVIMKETETNPAALLATILRFFAFRILADECSDLVDSKKCIKGIASFLPVRDMTDFAVEDLRRWKRWEYCDMILNLHGKKGYDTKIISNAVLRFALACPTPAAKTFVTVERSKNPEWVADIEESFALENQPVVAPKK